MKPLRDRAEFQRRIETSDGFGNNVSNWAGVFSRWCSVRVLRGTETVIAARLEGRQPAIVTVRHDPDTDSISPEMRVTIEGRGYNIRELPRLTEDRKFLEFLVESGVADG